MTLNGKSNKVSTNQNLVSSSLIYKYIYQRTIIPALIVIIVLAFLSVGVYFGSQKLVESYNEKTLELSAQDLSSTNASTNKILADKTAERDKLQDDYDNYYTKNPVDVKVDDSILTILSNDIKRLEAELKELEQQVKPDQGPVDVNAKYHIEELLLYIDTIRTQNVVIISLEDNKSAGASGNKHLVYENDVGQASFSLHGMATSSAELSQFMLKLNACEYVDYTRILSVETQSLSDGSNLYVFEITITPKVS